MDKVRQWFQSLTEREQGLVLLSAVVVVIGLFYWLIWAPLNTSLDSERRAVSARQDDLQWITRQANRAIQLRQSVGQKATFNGSLTQLVNQTASREGIGITRMQPQNEELKVWVDQADFQAVMRWLHDLERRGVQIIDIDLAKGDAPGQIKIRSLQLGTS
ncbi:type II secretion system protein M [Aestuariibacter halophilus]|uniref:Type II secretion system protein M n=1 Tax=Fluctibacter halophilus TaxID=226011 RepID=A0ABS8G9A6_9ALTE|nr:type II secretion system protein M [Aestuariibacter halophilus]MCC2617044.1 type II secretion system protein M [Aestuariibacter halophilus]